LISLTRAGFSHRESALPDPLNYTAVCVGDTCRAYSLVFRSNATLPVGRIHSGPEPFFIFKIQSFLDYFCLIYSNMKGTFCCFDLDANLNRSALNMTLPRTPYDGYANGDVEVQSFCDASLIQHSASASRFTLLQRQLVLVLGFLLVFFWFSSGFLLFETLGKP
jgi:hypothetical protein